MKTGITIALLLVAAIAPTARAIDFASNEVIVPVAGRFAGANQTQWRTDVTFANPDTVNSAEVRLSWEAQGIQPQVVIFTLGPRRTVTTIDIMDSIFHQATAAGFLRVKTTDPARKVYVRARIYNVGNAAGEFGQNVICLPLSQLGTTAFLPEMTAANGNRTNAGITNPSSSKISVTMKWYDQMGASVAFTVIPVPAHAVYQINDVFDWTGMPRDKPFTIEFRSDQTFYAWASIVRNDTGDAVFVPGTDAGAE